MLGVAGLALLLFSRSSAAQGGAPVQLAWQAPANCPQAAQVRQKVRDLLGKSAGEATPSRLRAEGRIEATGDRFRLTLNIHYDLVNATRVVEAVSCEDLGGVAAITLALLFRAEHSSSAPLTERDLGGASTAVGAQARSGDAESASFERGRREPAAREQSSLERAESHVAAASTVAEKREPNPQGQRVPSRAQPIRRAFASPFACPSCAPTWACCPIPISALVSRRGFATELGGFWPPERSGSRRITRPGRSLGYGAHFGRVSGELSGCRGFRLSEFELAPCLLLSLDDVSARGTGVGISSTSPRTAWVSRGRWFSGALVAQSQCRSRFWRRASGSRRRDRASSARASEKNVSGRARRPGCRTRLRMAAMTEKAAKFPIILGREWIS